MRAFVILAGTAALLAGCGNDQKRAEDAVRSQLSSQGTVTQVTMTKQADGGYLGNATVRMADGHEARVNCTVNPQGQGRCSQVIDQQLIDATTATLRQQMTARGLTVVEAQMAKENDDLISGDAVVRDASGAEQRVHCTAPRDPANGRFGLSCQAADAATAGHEGPAAPAPAEGEQAAPAEGGQ
jgi:hypothetical protein